MQKNLDDVLQLPTTLSDDESDTDRVSDSENVTVSAKHELYFE